MTTMRALQVQAWGHLPALAEVPRPTPGPGDTLVRMEAAALGHLDLTVAGGEFGIRPDLPYIGGLEGAGVVVESARWSPGTRVTLRGGGLGLTRPGTWAEYVAAPDDAVHHLRTGLSSPLAATCHDPLTTAHVALHRVARLGAWPLDGGETVVVAGAAGAVGSVVVQLAARAGAHVIGVVSTLDRAGLVPAVADEVVSAVDADRAAELAAQRPATLLVDTVGGPGLTARSSWVRAGGRVAVVGYTAGTSPVLDLPNWLLDDVALLPVNMLHRHAQGEAVADEMSMLLESGELTLAVDAYRLDRAAEAVDALRTGRANGRVALLVTE